MIDSNNKLKSLSRALLESAQSILSEKKEVKKDLANLAPPYNKVTHADVLVGRKVFSHDDVVAHKAKKGIKEDAQMVVIHAPILGDLDGELAEVLKRDPRDKTVHVQCEGMKYILKAGQYKELDEAVKNPYAVGMAAAMKSTGDTPPLKKSTITKAHEIAKAVKEELKGDQHKIDANKNGKVDAHDFHLLRKKKKVAEEVEQIDELSKKTMGSYIKKASGAEQPNNVMSPKNVPLTKIAAYQGDSETGHFGSRFNQATYDKADRLRKNRQTGITRAADKLAKEEVEQVDEISKATMGRYINRAKDSIDMASYRQGHKEAHGSSSKPLERKLSKRHKGIETAVKKLTKEESEQIDELSKDTMGRYINKAATKMGSQGVTAGLKIAADEKSSKNFKDMGKREKGIKLAVNKLTKEDVEGLEELSVKTLDNYRTKARQDIIDTDDSDENRINKRAKGYMDASKQVQKKLAKEDVELDEISSKTLFSYGKKARKEADKIDDPMHRARGRLLASKKTNPARGGYKLTKVAATFGEDVELSQEEIDFIEATMADLEEGRGRPPKEGSAAWKAKQQQDLADMPALGVQIRKAASINKPVTFMDGHSKHLSDNHINRFHDHMDSRKTSQDKSAFQKRAHKSHDEFVKAVSEPVPGRAKDTGEIVKYK